MPLVRLTLARVLLHSTHTPMKAEIPARKVLMLAALLPAIVALAQTAPKPASEEVQVLTEFRVNTSTDDGFIATESTSGTRVATEIIGAR